jgi:hypothetical protein
MQIILEASNDLKQVIDVAEAAKENNDSTALSENEKAFRSKVNSIYKTSTLALTITTTATVIFFPPFSFISAGLGLLLALLHLYDKRRDYKLSHAIAELCNKLVGKNEPFHDDENVISVKVESPTKTRGRDTTKDKRVNIKIENNRMRLSKHLFFSKKQPPTLSSSASNESAIEMVRLKNTL